MIKVIARDGINPRRRTIGGRSSILKVLPSDTPMLTSQSSLCGSTDGCIIIDMHSSISSGKLWVVHASDGCYGTNQVPLSSHFFVDAFHFTPHGPVSIWTTPVRPAAPAYPWPILILDLKHYVPLLERHVITYMVAGHANPQEAVSHPGYVLNSFLKDLAQTIVHNILFPATSEFMRPLLPPRVSTVEFWHAQLNYAVLRAEAALVTGGSAESVAGDQLCVWNTIAPDAIIPATHLTLFLPPPLGAYVMANHQTHRDFKPHASSSPTDIPTFTVQQSLHFHLPEVCKNQSEMLNMARYAAADGYITPAAIPFLSHSLTNEHMTFQKIKWSLRFPLPTPTPTDPNRRFSATPSFQNSPSSGEALDGAIRVAAPFTYQSPSATLLPQTEFLRLPAVLDVLGPWEGAEKAVRGADSPVARGPGPDGREGPDGEEEENFGIGSCEGGVGAEVEAGLF